MRSTPAVIVALVGASFSCAGWTHGEPPGAGPQDGAPASPAPEAAGGAPAGGAKITPKGEGEVLVDDRFILKGDGTAKKPYEVTWDQLVSAEETYDPHLGKTKLPERISMLDGKRVRITGYVAYPMFVDTPRELLVMLNQWDGCCIGVPPTPYDAVEIKLLKPVSREQRLATYGVIEGTLGVKPYLAGDWLVGLYIIEDGEFTPKKNTGLGS